MRFSASVTLFSEKTVVSLRLADDEFVRVMWLRRGIVRVNSPPPESEREGLMKDTRRRRRRTGSTIISADRN